MPKERIYGQVRTLDAPGNVQHQESFDLSLQWDKAQEWHERDADGGAGHVTLSIIEATADHGERVAGYVWLDRSGCNRLIEKIRRARDAAYGRDT